MTKLSFTVVNAHAAVQERVIQTEDGPATLRRDVFAVEAVPDGHVGATLAFDGPVNLADQIAEGDTLSVTIKRVEQEA